MPKKRPLDAAAPLTRRIEQLLRLEWAENKSAMARALGVSQPVISRVTSGRQEPPASMLLALAKQPRMNLRWLFLGEGEPLTQRDLGAGGGRFCPVARRLLPGAPGDFPHLLEGASRPVADAFYSDTAYWFAVPPDCPLAAEEEEKVKAGDFLLMETSPEWTRRVERMYFRVIALRQGGGGEDTFLLGRLGWGEADPLETPDCCPLRVFGRSQEALLESRRACEGEAEPRPTGKAKGSAKKPPPPPRYRLDDVVGVCMVLQRSR